MISESDNTQYTIDTLVPVSKNFLKKTLIKNEATKKANRELLNICRQALVKQAEKFKAIDKDKQKNIEEYNKKLKEELYEKTQKIKLLKIFNENKKINAEKQKIQQIQIDEKINSNNDFIELKKQHEFIKKILLNPLDNKKEVLSVYKNIPDSNIDIFNIMAG
jgi:hypothetical protein